MGVALGHGSEVRSLGQSLCAVLDVGDENFTIFVRPEPVQVNQDADHKVALTTAKERL